MKGKMKRFLSTLCMVLMIFQSVAESGFVLYAQAGDEKAVYAAENAEASACFDENYDGENASDGNGTFISGAVTVSDKTVSDNESNNDDIISAQDDTAFQKLKDEDDLEENDDKITLQSGVVIEDGIVTYDGKTYGAFENGVFTVAADVTAIPDIEPEEDGVFSEWNELQEIRFAEGSKAVRIREDSFEDCVNLKVIDFSNASNLTTIESGAFSDCIRVSQITFHDKLQYIDSSAFKNCKGVTDVVLGPNLVSLGGSAFSGCEKLEKVTVKSTNLSLDGSNFFAGCKIKEFSLEAADEEKNKIVPAHLFKGAGFDPAATIVIPDKVVELGEQAFAGSTITNVKFPDNKGFKTISDSAFDGCGFLKKIELTDYISYIGDSAFKNCESITELVITDYVTHIGDEAFKGCILLKDLTLGQGTVYKDEEGEYAVGSSVFADCISLESVEIPKKNKRVGKKEFSGCISLRNVVFSEDVEEIGDGAFAGCMSLVEIELPSNKKFVMIPSGCFEDCTNLKTVIIREGITDIGAGAFLNCSHFETNTFPESLLTIGSKAFKNCLRFEDLTIPSNVVAIGDSAFENCDKINTVILNSVVLEECGEGIFYLDYLQDIVFPEGIYRIPDNFFCNATWVTDRVIIIPKSITHVGNSAFEGGPDKTSNYKEIRFEANDKVTYIGDSAFSGCKAITNFTIPESVTYIGDKAFEDCIKLQEIIIPEKVTYLGKSAFEGCSLLENIHFNAVSVNSSEKNIFADCNISNIYIGDKVELFPDNLFRGAHFAEADKDNKPITISINIPASTTRIGDYSLPNIVNLETIVFAEGSQLDYMGQYCLQQCVALKSCRIPDSVKVIGTRAFYGCENLVDFRLPLGLEELGAGAFEGCKKIESVVIGEKLKDEIPSNVFKDCEALKTIEFVSLSQNQIKKIEDSAFEGCTSVESFTVPASVEYIKEKAFSGCRKLSELNFTGGSVLKEIDRYAFHDCPLVGSIILPDTVTDIGAYAFDAAGAGAKTVVYLPASIDDIDEGAFNKANAEFLEFHVVPGSYAAKWLTENGFAASTVNVLKITYVLFEDDDNPNKPDNGGNPLTYEAGDTTVLVSGNWAGHVFEGWYLDETYTTEITSLEGKTEDLTIYAKWSPITYSITYELNGGINGEGNPSTYTTDSDLKLADAVREGYEFSGWFTDPADPESKVTRLKGLCSDITLYALWDGGKVEMPAASVPEGEVREGTAIKLTCATAGATIYYALNGNEPSYTVKPYKTGVSMPGENTFVYSDPIIATGAELTIKAIAVKDDSADSDMLTVSYNIISETGFWGDIAEGDRAGFKDASEVPKGIWVCGVEDVVYTGDAVTFNLRVYDHKTRLVDGVDYMVKYSNNKNAGNKADKKAPTVTVSGKGNYSKKKKTVKFTISARDINGEGFSVNDLYLAGGKKVKPVPELYFNGTKLKNKKDFIVSPASITSTQDIMISGTKNFTGTRTIKCTVKNGKSIAKAKITLPAQSVAYDAADKKLIPNVMLGKTLLTMGSDYELAYEGIDGPGRATVIVRGIGAYAGEKRAEYTIEGENTITDDMVSTTMVLDNGGKPVSINVTVKSGDTVLAEGVDYLCERPAVIKTGAKVTVSGTGKYGGIVSKKLEGMSVAQARVMFLAPDGSENASKLYGMAAGEVKPKLSVTLGGVKLIEKVDYTVTYSGNDRVGEAELTITGKGFYSGEQKLGFTIEKQDLSKLFGYATDVTYKAKAGIVFGSKLTIYDANGKAIGKENYDVSYAYAEATTLANGMAKNPGDEVGAGDIVKDGTLITVKAAGKDNYTGIFTYNIKVGSKSIAKAKFKVADQYYNGSPVTPEKKDIQVKKISASDYEIVGYIANVATGKGQIIVRGTGAYSGTKVVSFKIKQKEFQ